VRADDVDGVEESGAVVGVAGDGDIAVTPTR